MRILTKVAKAFRDYGAVGFASMVMARIYERTVPRTREDKWKSGIRSELLFWDSYFRTNGLDWPHDYSFRLDPDALLQSRPASLLPDSVEVEILDVGAGPLTFLGKKAEGRRIRITAVDPLAAEYETILSRYGVVPVVRTEKLAAEDLTKRFPSSTFDLVFARNCIDHAFDPEVALVQMIEVVKKGSYVMLEHRPNEAVTENYSGFHQWNFSLSLRGDFLISSKHTEVNASQKYVELAAITCETVTEGTDGEWLITRIRKK